MTQKSQASGPDMLDIVFTDRNKAYGAYQLRRTYPYYLARALGSAFLLILSFLAVLLLLTSARLGSDETADGPIVIDNWRRTPPPVDQPKALPPPPASAAPKPALQRFVPPVVIDDDAVPEEEMQRTPDELLLANTQIGSIDQDGDQDVPPALDVILETDFGNDTKGKGSGSDDNVYEGFDVQKMPSFPGGESELLLYLSRNIVYPAMARESGITGPVVLSFVVNTDGSVSDIAVLKDPGGGCAKETIRVVQSMPRWSPGEANGRAVKVRFILPVRFDLQ